jgi:coenzyme F420-reducing hydrogenase delta subunit/ferredoxin
LSEQTTEAKVAVKIEEDSCSRCIICASLCPFDALRKDAEKDKTILDIEKCQVCGLCYAACPSHVIDILYYDVDSLTKYLKRAKKQYASDTLVIMCKGSAPDLARIEKLFGITKFIPLTVPCVGRIPEDVFLKALIMGIKRIYVLACDEDYCRYDHGSPVEGRRIMALNLMLSQLGYGKEAIVLKRNSLKVKANSDLCIGCGNCVFYCPWSAPTLVSPGLVKVDLSKCHGCGLCVSMCPAFALDLANWEKDRISMLISQLATEMASPKILVLCCQWAMFPDIEEKTNGHTRCIFLPCAGRADTAHIVEAFVKGFDGVLIVACAEDDCKSEGAGGKVQRPISTLKGRLGQIGYGERIGFCTISPRYPEAFANELSKFSDQIANIGKGKKE